MPEPLPKLTPAQLRVVARMQRHEATHTHEPEPSWYIEPGSPRINAQTMYVLRARGVIVEAGGDWRYTNYKLAPAWQGTDA